MNDRILLHLEICKKLRLNRIGVKPKFEQERNEVDSAKEYRVLSVSNFENFEVIDSH